MEILKKESYSLSALRLALCALRVFRRFLCLKII
jgi:hypothetical protein